ncbi:MAG: TraB/GumN family protein [Trueperaceae bacterium]
MTLPPPAAPTGPVDGPRRVLDVGGTRVTLLGTAHVSRRSAEEVRETIERDAPDAVAIELDAGRYAALDDARAFARLDLLDAWRQKKLGMVAVSLALGAFQQRLADQLGIEPGAEMRAAIAATKARGARLWLVDRDLGTTLRRVVANVPWWQRATLLAGVVGSVLNRQPVAESEIERLKEGDVLASTFAEFAEDEARIFEPLIAERDRYMALRLRQELAAADAAGSRPRSVLVVIGAGHLAGLAAALEEPDAGPEATRERLSALRTTPKPGAWQRIAPWALVALVLTGFAIGFAREPDLGWRLLLDWTILNGGLAGLGVAIALGHPLTVLATALAAPFTSLNPFVGAGFVAAGVELALRRPRVGDLAALRRDVTVPKGWWTNRAARTLLVFALATLGSVIGTYAGGFRIAERLLN